MRQIRILFWCRHRLFARAGYYYSTFCPDGSIPRGRGTTDFLGRMSGMVFEKVRMILSNQFDVEEDVITMETNIADDLGADSLDVVDMLMSLEDEFDVEIPDEEIEKMRTVAQVVAYIEEHL